MSLRSRVEQSILSHFNSLIETRFFLEFPLMSSLYYTTFKYVVIRDKRLGLAYYAMTAAVLLYACTEIIVQKGYVEYDNSPLGSMRLMLKTNKSSGHDISTENYCCQAHSQLAAGSSPPDPATCSECRRLDAKELSWPVESKTITIATFFKDKWQVLANQSNDDDDSSEDDHSNDYDAHYVTQVSESYYPLSPESVLVKVEHSFVASLFTNRKTGDEGLAGSNRQMDGYLYAENGKRLRKISAEGQPDKISLGELLQAAGVENGLGAISDAANAKGESNRLRGCVLRVTIAYENDKHTWFGLGTTEYSYHVRHVPYTDYRIHQLIPIYGRRSMDGAGGAGSSSTAKEKFKADARLVRKRYGVHITFDQVGKLGMYSWSNFLTKLISSICLITIIPTILDTAILYILPGRTLYRQFVYEDNEDELDSDAVDAYAAQPAAGGRSGSEGAPVEGSAAVQDISSNTVTAAVAGDTVSQDCATTSTEPQENPDLPVPVPGQSDQTLTNRRAQAEDDSLAAEQ